MTARLARPALYTGVLAAGVAAPLVFPDYTFQLALLWVMILFWLGNVRTQPLDDITELVSAQRTSAWADVARRIAHEIKNPLTPIQLSAERLRRKFGKNLTEDREVFEQCTDTIIRQVGDIGRMVDEFSSFARMPKPVVEAQDLAETIRQAVFLMRVGNPDIEFESDLPQGGIPARARQATRLRGGAPRSRNRARQTRRLEDRYRLPGTRGGVAAEG